MPCTYCTLTLGSRYPAGHIAQERRKFHRLGKYSIQSRQIRQACSLELMKVFNGVRSYNWDKHFTLCSCHCINNWQQFTTGSKQTVSVCNNWLPLTTGHFTDHHWPPYHFTNWRPWHFTNWSPVVTGHPAALLTDFLQASLPLYQLAVTGLSAALPTDRHGLPAALPNNRHFINRRLTGLTAALPTKRHWPPCHFTNWLLTGLPATLPTEGHWPRCHFTNWPPFVTVWLPLQRLRVNWLPFITYCLHPVCTGNRSGDKSKFEADRAGGVGDKNRLVR